jgi:hypothetical protein
MAKHQSFQELQEGEKMTNSKEIAELIEKHNIRANKFKQYKLVEEAIAIGEKNARKETAKAILKVLKREYNKKSGKFCDHDIKDKRKRISTEDFDEILKNISKKFLEEALAKKDVKKGQGFFLGLIVGFIIGTVGILTIWEWVRTVLLS